MELLVLGTGSADGWPNPFCRCENCEDARDRGELRTHTSVLVAGVILFDVGPDVARSAERAGATLADVEHIVVSHGHPDHLEPATLLWRSWLARPNPLTVHAPAAALDVIRPWLAPDDVSDRAVALLATAAGSVTELVTSRGVFRLTSLAANHDRAGESPDVHAGSALIYLLECPDGTRIIYATDTAALPRETLTSLSDSRCAIAFVDETFGTTTTHGTGHHDLESFAEQLDALRSVNAITSDTDVIAVHLSHHNPVDLPLRLHALGARVVADRTVVDTNRSRPGYVHLLIGGARSGKSLLAESLAAASPSVTYVATAPAQPGDAEWDERIAAHQLRRPAHWKTVETLAIVEVLDSATRRETVLIDCLSLWVTGVLDELDAWASEESLDVAVSGLRKRSAELVTSLADTAARVIVVTNEVGQGVVPATKSGRVFRDELGRLNAAVSAVAGRADFVIAGRLLPLRPSTLDALARQPHQKQSPGDTS
jgi:adenosylcobinamide kinase/adenosylcobinamide-phosphate guanylyltransferase